MISAALPNTDANTVNNSLIQVKSWALRFSSYQPADWGIVQQQVREGLYTKYLIKPEKTDGSVS